MELPFSTGTIRSGAPSNIKRIIGNGLILFKAADGQVYFIDWMGNIELFTDVVKVGASMERISFVVGNAFYYKNNELQASGSPGENAGGTDTLTITDFIGKFINTFSVGGINVAEPAFSWDQQTNILSLSGNKFTDGDSIILIGEGIPQSSGGTTGGNILYDATISAAASQRQFPAVPAESMKGATNTLVFYNGSLLKSGLTNVEYKNTPDKGYITLNFDSNAGDTIRIVAYTVAVPTS